MWGGVGSCMWFPASLGVGSGGNVRLACPPFLLFLTPWLGGWGCLRGAGRGGSEDAEVVNPWGEPCPTSSLLWTFSPPKSDKAFLPDNWPFSSFRRGSFSCSPFPVSAHGNHHLPGITHLRCHRPTLISTRGDAPSYVKSIT